MSTIRPSFFHYALYKHFVTIASTSILLLFCGNFVDNFLARVNAQTTHDYNEVTVAPYYNNDPSLFEQKQPVACYRCIPRISNDCSRLNSKGVPVLNRKVICDNVDDVCLSAIGQIQHPVGSPEEEALKKQLNHGDSFRLFTCASESDLRYIGLVNNGTQNNCQTERYENLQLLQLFVPQDRARERYEKYVIKSCICNGDFCNTEHNHNDKYVPVITAKADYYAKPEDETTAAPHHHSDTVHSAAAVVPPAVVIAAAPTTTRQPVRPRTTPTTTQKPESSGIGWLTIFMILCGILIALCLLFALIKMLRNRKKKRQANISGNRTGARTTNGTTVEHDETLLTQTEVETRKTNRKVNRDSV